MRALSSILRIISSTGGIASQIIETVKDYFPPSLSDKERKQIEMAIEQSARDYELKIKSLAAQEDENFRDFMIKYEGKQKDNTKFIQVIRGLVRPLITYAVDICYLYAFMSPLSFTHDQMKTLFPLVIIVNAFWFGDRLIQKSGILDILSKKKEGK